MPEDLRIRLHSSLRFHRLCHAICGAGFICCCLSAGLADYRLLVPALGLAVLYRALLGVDSSGFVLQCKSIRAESTEWCCGAGDHEPLVACVLQSHSKATNFLWLECQWGNTRRSLLIFPDAMSYEHWRLLRRQLRLQPQDTSHQNRGKNLLG